MELKNPIGDWWSNLDKEEIRPDPIKAAQEMIVRPTSTEELLQRAGITQPEEPTMPQPVEELPQPTPKEEPQVETQPYIPEELPVESISKEQPITEGVTPNETSITNTDTTTNVTPKVDDQSVSNVETAPVEAIDQSKPTKLKPFNEYFVVNKLGPVESKKGHRDVFGKLITSKAGAKGQYQILPSTAKDPGFGLPSIDLEKSSVKEQGIWAMNYLNKLSESFNGDIEKTLASYNWGIGNVKKAVEKHGDKWKTYIPAETKRYIQKLTK